MLWKMQHFPVGKWIIFRRKMDHFPEEINNFPEAMDNFPEHFQLINAIKCSSYAMPTAPAATPSRRTPAARGATSAAASPAAA